MTTEVSVPDRRLSNWLRRIRAIRAIHLVPVLALVALSAWVFASPVGASPDDDYHLASIWCANDARADLCAPDSFNGERARLILPGLASAPCFVADPNANASCQEWTPDPSPTVAANHGNWIGAYPPLFYAVMSVFASTDIQSSALAMRFASSALFVAVTTALTVLLPRPLRVPLLAGWAVAIVPLGVFLIASNNPGGWGLIGVGSTWIAALGWFRSSGPRGWALGALTALSVVVGAGARTDAAVYCILALGIAAFLSFTPSRTYGLRLILPLVLMGIAAVFFRTSGYSAVAEVGLSGVTESENRNPLGVLAFNLVSIPQIWTGIFGSWGLGWKMETWPGFYLVEFSAMVVFVGIASIGLRSMDWRKLVMIGALVVTLYALPVYILTAGMSVVGENVQPRYLIPLVVVLAGLLLLPRGDLTWQPGLQHVIPAVVLLSLAHALALNINIRRYTSGLEFGRLSLEAEAEWWWSGVPFGPTAVWVVGSLAFAGAVAVLGMAWLRSQSRMELAA